MKNDQDLVSMLIAGVAIVFIMGGLQLLLPLLIIGSIAYYFIKQDSRVKIINPNQTTSMGNFSFEEFKRKVTHTSGMVVLVVLGVVLLANMIVIIPAGQTGVYHLFGKVRDKEVSSGIHLINPFASIRLMSIRTEQYTMSIAPKEGQRTGDDSIEALTKEGLKVALDITVLYHLMEGEASDVYRNIGVNYEEKIIRPEVRSAIREVIALYEAKDIYSEKREEAVEKIKTIMVENIGPRGIEIETVLLRNVILPAMLTGAIEDKLTAEQEAQKYDFVLQKEEKEADRKRIEAAGQRDAQSIINQSLTDRYLQYLYIQNLENREGTIYVPYDLPLLRGI
ncbi:MAG: prohibitin family protein [Candidatus Pacebacteria bacterium]|nr:prohibitin family protein [Candidatus Paceibacterota bacterium]